MQAAVLDACVLYPLVKRHRQALVNPPKSAEEYRATLNGCGLRNTALRLQAHVSAI